MSNFEKALHCWAIEHWPIFRLDRLPDCSADLRVSISHEEYYDPTYGGTGPGHFEVQVHDLNGDYLWGEDIWERDFNEFFMELIQY